MITSLVQRLMSRRTKTLLPMTQSLLLPKATDLENEKRELRQRQQTQTKYYNRSAKDLPSPSEGDVVRMKPFKLGDKSWPKAQVTARLDERSYTIETENGAVYRRNRQHLQKTSEPPIESQNPIESPVSKQQPNAGSASEKAVTTTTVTPSHSSAPQHLHTPEECRRTQRTMRTPAYLKDYVHD